MASSTSTSTTDLTVNKPSFLYNSEISDLAFYVLSEAEIIRDSVCTVTNKETMKNDAPIDFGVYDPRLGTTDFSFNCYSCNSKRGVCPGHFGSIELKYPIKSPMFRDELLKWLKITCYYCGGIMIQPKIKVALSKKLGELVKNSRTIKSCPHCGKQHLQVVKDKLRPSVFYRIQETDKKILAKEEFMNHHILEVIERISDSDVLLIGKPLRCHPRNFILRTIPVSPNTIRPDIRRIGGGATSSSDTTSLLKQIVDINNALPDGQISEDLKELYFNLDMTVYTMMKGGNTGSIKLVTNTNKPPVSVAEHWPKKVGRVRRNLMGKRVEYMIRSVVIGDCFLRIDEVGIPEKHAIEMEIPETVNERNRSRLMVYFMNKGKYPGCGRIIKKTGGMFSINNIDPTYQLQDGDIIMRHLIAGDYVLFNRQPTLLFSNISGMKVVIVTGHSLRINALVCKYFNADFDGDNMTAIIVQNIQSQNECRSISKVGRWMISPQYQAPLVGLFQDSMIGIAEMTRHGVRYNKWHAMQLFSDITNHADLTFNKNKSTDVYTNYELTSKLLPEINIIDREPSMYDEKLAGLIKYDPMDIKVNIKRGIHTSGIIDKAISGQESSGSIFHIIANEYGSDRALETLYNFQQLTIKNFYMCGYTIGIKDITISPDATKAIKIATEGMIAKSLQITEKINTGKLIPPIGVLLKDYYEMEQSTALSIGDEFIYPIIADIDFYRNNILKMILVKSEGKIDNFVSMNAAIGSQTIDSKRFIDPQSGIGRCSPYFTRYDSRPAANGFIESSFREGVSNNVYAFAAGEARNGAISNALKTSTTGHKGREAMKNLESIITDNLRKATKSSNIIQPLYGECAIDSSKMEKNKFPTIKISTDKFKSYHMMVIRFTKEFHNDQVQSLLDGEFTQLSEDRAYYRKIYLQMESHNPKEYILTDVKYMPINLLRIIDDTVYNYGESFDKNDKSTKLIDPVVSIAMIKELCDNLGYVYTNEMQKNKKQAIPQYIQSAVILMKILIRSYLCTKVLVDKNITTKLLQIIIDKILFSYKKSLIDYGSMVGLLAAQCISEPLTQFVLNSKHRVGVQASNKTSVIVRYQEILGVKSTENMKNPHMLIMVKSEYEQDRNKVQEIANHIEMMNFDRFVSGTHIFYEKYRSPVHPNFRHELNDIKLFDQHHIGNKSPGDLASWCIRFTINKEEMILKSMSLETIVTALQSIHKHLFIMYTPENSDNVYIRCYFKNSLMKQVTDYYNYHILPAVKTIKSTVIRGTRNITATQVVDIIKNTELSDGSLTTEQKIYGIYTSGTNMSDILDNNMVDGYRTQSDSIAEIEEIYGIVAAREKLINELSLIFSELNKIHLTIVASEMSSTGVISSIQRSGLAKRESANVCLKLAFSQPIQTIIDASINGNIDHISGLSAPLIIGSNPKIGTCYNSVIVNERFIKENSKLYAAELDEL